MTEEQKTQAVEGHFDRRELIKKARATWRAALNNSAIQMRHLEGTLMDPGGVLGPDLIAKICEQEQRRMEIRSSPNAVNISDGFVRAKSRWLCNRSSQCARRSRKKTRLTEWQIQRRLERFRLHQVEVTLEAGTPLREDSLKKLETLLRAGIRPSRGLMDAIDYNWGSRDLRLYVEWFAALEEKDVSYRNDYARKFYANGVEE